MKLNQLYIKVSFISFLTILFLPGITLAQFQPQNTEELQTAVDMWVDDNATALDIYGEINTWDVSLITDMTELFKDKTTFNDDIGSWDVSSMTDMSYMFYFASSFNQNLSSWDVSSVTDMSFMFYGADAFNQDLSSWDVSSGTDMTDMFLSADSLSDENKCAIDTAWNYNEAWPYDWSNYCSLSGSTIEIPNEYVLHPAYPNPFNPMTNIRYEIAEDVFVSITVYDLLGNVVNNLINTNQSSGYKSVQWNATNNQGQPVSAGVYLYSIEAGDFRQTKKMILLL